MLQHTCSLSEAQQEEILAAHIAACVYRTSLASTTTHVGREVQRCPACAAEAADLLALLKWREEEAPFTRNAFPLPDNLTSLLRFGRGKEGR